MTKRVLLLFLCAAGLAASRPEVTKIEPPNWWSGTTVNPVRILIRGRNLRGATLTGLPNTGTVINDAGTYVFADVVIPPQPGSYPLTIHTTEGDAIAPFRVDQPLPREGRFQGFSPDDVIYLIMPDRFANGDPSNDDPAVSRGLFDPAKPRYYHGGDLKGIRDHLPYLKDLGVTAIWLTPVYDNVNHLNQRVKPGGEPTTDYHGYGAVDYYGVEEHFGTLADLRALVDAAHANGIKVIQDQVANHTGPHHPWVTDPPLPTWYHGTPSNHLKESWQIWSVADPHANRSVVRTVLDGWFANILPDMNQDSPEVSRYEIQNSIWWLGAVGFDGIRQDTVPYVPKSFWQQWSTAIHLEFPNVRIVGEVYDPDPNLTSFFQGPLDSVLDYPAYFQIRNVFARGKPFGQLAASLAHDRLYRHPEMLVTFLGNHDVERFMNEPGATPEGLKLAFTFLLTSRGIPQLYYGDELGMTGGKDPDNRRDFPASAFTTPPPLFGYVCKLMRLRAELEPLRRGDQTDLSISDTTWVYSRADAKGTVVVAFNNGKSQAAIDLPPGAWKPMLEGVQAIGSRVTLPARSAEIFVSN